MITNYIIGVLETFVGFFGGENSGIFGDALNFLKWVQSTFPTI